MSVVTPIAALLFGAGWFRNWLSGVQLVEQRLGLFQIERVEAFNEPAGEEAELRGIRRS